MVIELNDGRRALLEVDGYRVTWSASLLTELENLLGSGAVRTQVAISNGRREERQSRSRRPNFQSS